MKKNLLEELKRMNTLMGINGINDTYQFTIPNDIKKTKINEETDSVTSGGGQEEFDYIEFGNFGKIPLVKGAIKNYVGNQDIGTLLGLKNNPDKYKYDEKWGWYEEFEKKSWGTYDAITPDGNIKKNYVVKRFLPTINAPDIQWIKKNKIPFGFTAKNGKKFSLLFKLVEPTIAIMPDKYPDRQDRGWILVTPGSQATTGNYDYGSTYYEVGTMEPYNIIAPKVEGDLSTTDIDTRTNIDKIVQNKYFFVGQLVVYLVASIASEGLLMRVLPPGVVLNVARLRIAKVITQTLVEIGVNGTLAYYYFSKSQGNDEYEKIGYSLLAFCLLPMLQALPGVRQTFLGSQFSDTALLKSMASKVNMIMKNTNPETFWNITYQKMGYAEQDMWMAFQYSLRDNGEQWAILLNDAMNSHEFWVRMRELYKKRGLSQQEIDVIITQTKQRFPGIAARVEDVKIAIDPISNKTSVIKFTAHFGSIYVYSKLAEKLYDVFTDYKGDDPNKAKKHAENFKKITDQIEKDPNVPEFEKWVLKQAQTNNKVLQTFVEQIKNINSLELTQAMFVNGLLSDETYNFIRRAALEIAADEQFVNDKDVRLQIHKYMVKDLCWETDFEKKLNVDFIKKIKEKFYKIHSAVLTNDKNVCFKLVNSEPKCVPCWGLLKDVTDYNTIIYPKDLKQTSNNKPTVITNEPKLITNNSAILTANVTNDGGSNIFDRGFYYSSLDTTPTSGETNVFTQKISGETGDFEFMLTGLSANTIYYYQAYALNVNGEGLGTIKDFVTLRAESSDNGTNQNLTTTTTISP
jgi:hypothetical protein